MQEMVFSKRKRSGGRKGTWHEVKGSPVADNCVEGACPHIRDDRCPLWGRFDKRSTRTPVVVELFDKKGYCPFLKWAIDDRTLQKGALRA